MLPRPHRRALLGIAAGATVTALFGATLAVPANANPVDRNGRDLSGRQIGKTTARSLPDKWLVQVKGAPALRGGSRSAALAAQASVKTAAAQAGVKVSVLHSYTRVWNGFSVKADKAQADRLSSLSGVTAIYPVYPVSLPDKKVNTDLRYSLPMIGADKAQLAGYDGAGIKVGVIDTGIDYNHPDLGGSGTEGNNADFGPSAPRVKYGYDFVGDAYDADDAAHDTPVPDNYPDDCNGHGTHVSGIIGADGDPTTGHVLGVAPKVTFGAYRVFGCEGSTDTEVILAAMDMAAADHMDVVNMSLGSDFDSWPDYPDAAAADALTAAGTIVVAAAGNAGDSGLFSTGSPSVGKSVISVASVENTNSTNRYFAVSPTPTGTDGHFIYIPGEPAPLPPDSGTFDLARASVQNGCTAFSGVTDQVALVQRGTCNFYDKALNAQNAGAKAVVIYDNGGGIGTADLTPSKGDPAITIPVVMISQDEGQALWDQLDSQSTTLTWNLLTKVEPNPLAGTISSFSAYGLAADLTMTPDLAAPGGNIWSTFPLEKQGYANLSGTSMAAPQVTGAVALLLQAKSALKGNALAVRSALQNTATPINKMYDAYSGKVIDGLYEPTVHQGAGLIQIDKAIKAATSATTVTPGKISLGENRSSYYKTTLKLVNNGTSTETYKLSLINSLNVGAAPTTYWYDYNNKKVSSKFSANTISVKAGKTASVSVYIKQPSLKTGWIYGGWVKLTKSDNSKSLVVPFAGMYGDYQKVKLLQDLYDVGEDGYLYVAADLPSLAAPDGQGGYNLLTSSDGKHTFDLSDSENTPYLLFHLDYPASDVYFNVYKATSSGKKGSEVFGGYKTFMETGEMGRDNSYYALPFNGKIPFNSATSAGLTVPNGDYVLEIRALKALGNPKTSSHWETWTSPAFTINRSHT